MDPADMAGALAEGIVKQDADDADHAAVDNAAADADAGGAAAVEAVDADAKKDEEDAAPAAAAAPLPAQADDDVVPVYVNLPMPQAEAAALGRGAATRCHALSNAEAALLLKGFAQQERAANPAFEPSAAQQRAAKYAERMGGSRNPDAVVRMRE
jgi:hypothetical protein